ncbi:ABC transporter ATP-binding protein [Lactobacillus sp. LL6]|uniref:ABC transporter ATP-binding protein n=1 Tax=Lactobacillus sp. LL6 TaxID=2596827 RepID=UPI001186AEA3|nr:ABC transporter ATP-binding protein [Lactobacillus sp. LL6]TSO25533.1 ABC transporter ATP-binding protein [Lactobacillus sp. LL6]
MEKTLLKVCNLKKYYGKKLILNNISCSINQGEIVGLIGHNGVGKTTLMKCILGTTNYDYGSRIFDNNKIKNKECLQNTGALIEHPGIYPFLTGKENIELLNSVYSTRKLTYLLNKFQMESFINQKVSSYSLGMQQKLGIIEAFLSGSKLVILDEPINALDPMSVKKFREAIEYFKNKGITFLISTHIIDEISKVADKLWILNKKELTELNNKRNTIHIVTVDTSNNAKLKQILKVKNIKYHNKEDKVVIKCNSSFEVGEWITTIVKNKLNIDYLDINKNDLEDEVLKIMER